MKLKEKNTNSKRLLTETPFFVFLDVQTNLIVVIKNEF